MDKLVPEDGALTEEEAGYAGPLAEIALRRGDLAAAVEAGSKVLDDRRLSSLGIAALPLRSAVSAAIRLGETERVERWLASPWMDDAQDSLFGLHRLIARGQHSQAMGWHQTAYATFRTCGERMVAGGVDAPGLALWRVDAAEALLLLGRGRDEGPAARGRAAHPCGGCTFPRFDAAGEGGVQPAGAAGGAARRSGRPAAVLP
jgi:hypothetical protein